MPDEPEPQVQQPEPAAEAAELRPFDEVLAELNRHLEATPDAVRDKLRSHPVVSGLSGQIAQSLAQRQLEVERQALASEAARTKEQELLRLADEDPEAFAAQFRTEKQAELAKKELESIRYDERRLLTEQLSRANAALPEWKQLSPAEQSKVASAVKGVPADQIFAVYQTAVVDVIADRRADKRTEERLVARLAAEKEAWTAEQAARRVRTTPAPALAGGRAAGVDSDEPDFTKDKPGWDKWYAERHPHLKLGT